MKRGRRGPGGDRLISVLVERDAERGHAARLAALFVPLFLTALLAHVRVARSRLERAAGDLERAQRAIAEFPDPGRLPAIAASVVHDLATARANVGNRELVEDSSAAELAVLRCLATSLSRREIGARLYISLNTVKTHTRELYRKLGAISREEALARAEALGLLDLTESPG